MTNSDSNIVDVTPIGKEKPARLTKDDVEKEYWNRISFRGERGQIVLFPGYLPHQVLSNESNEERISLSFNIILDWNK